MENRTYYRANEIVVDAPTAYELDKVVEYLGELPHGNYGDDYGKGFSAAINAAVETLKAEMKQ